HESLDHAQRAQQIYRSTGHPAEADALHAIGINHIGLGSHREALTYCEEALRLNQELGSAIAEAATWDSVGFIHHHLGDYRKAVEFYDRSLALVRGLGDLPHQAEVLIHIGEAHAAAEDQRAARDAWQEALTSLDRFRHPAADMIRAKLAELPES